MRFSPASSGMRPRKLERLSRRKEEEEEDEGVWCLTGALKGSSGSGHLGGICRSGISSSGRHLLPLSSATWTRYRLPSRIFFSCLSCAGLMLNI